MTLPQPIATWRLGRHVGREVRVFDRLDSTNSLALALADDPASDGLAIVARCQDAGRGQYGRSWSAPVGSSVLLSAILFPPPPLRPPAILTSWAAVAVCEVIGAELDERRVLSPLNSDKPEATTAGFAPSPPGFAGGEVRGEGGRNPSLNIENSRGFAVPPSPPAPLPPQSRGERGEVSNRPPNPAARHDDSTIKWPNDILVAGKKVAGILIEQRTTAGVVAAVIGIGVNVRQSPADFAELPDATSLAIVSGRMLDTDAVCRALLERLDAEYARLLEGGIASLGERWQRRLDLVGKPVIAECFERTIRGLLIEVGLSAVVLQVDGDLVHLAPESIRHLQADSSPM